MFKTVIDKCKYLPNININLKTMNSKKILKSVLILVFSIATISCSKDDDSSTTPTPNPSTSLGSFVGNIQVSDDPQTNLGYIYNAVVTVTTSGSSAIIKITGNEGFDREYNANVTFSQNGTTNMNIVKQTKPAEKNSSGTVIISNNSLGLDINYVSDNITVRETPTSPTTVIISGKVRMLGSNLVKQ